MKSSIPLYGQVPFPVTLYLFTFLILVCSMVGCASSPTSQVTEITAVKKASDQYQQTVKQPQPTPAAKKQAALESQLRAVYQRWKGTPHHFGGNDRKGVDCSGLVQQVYEKEFQYPLPRTTLIQVKVGTPVQRKQLKAGDLVFFKLPPPGYPRHVGIYLSQGEFFHASKSKGVIISQLNQGYWHQAYSTARRHPIQASIDNTTDPKAYTQVGKASYYGKKFHGQATASGEPFN